MENSLTWPESAGAAELELPDVHRLQDENEDFWGVTEQGMFIAGNDDFVALRLLHGKPYENVSRELWRKICSDAEIAIDIGAHTGVFTLDAHRAGAAHVVSIEPNPINYARLVVNLRLNGFSPEGALLAAAGNEPGLGELVVKPGLVFCSAGGRMGMKVDPANKIPSVKVPARVARLDDVIDPQFWPDVRAIKVDAENYTGRALVGMQKILRTAHPDIIVEVIQGGLTEILAPLGYKFWRIWETGKIEPCADLSPYDPHGAYNGTDENCKNRFASVRGLP